MAGLDGITAPSGCHPSTRSRPASEFSICFPMRRSTGNRVETNEEKRRGTGAVAWVVFPDSYLPDQRSRHIPCRIIISQIPANRRSLPAWVMLILRLGPVLHTKSCWVHKRIHCTWGPKPRRIHCPLQMFFPRSHINLATVPHVDRRFDNYSNPV